jgi:hypothetical protein
MLSDWQRFLQFATAFNGFLRTTITIDDAQAYVRRAIEAREENFLQVVRTAVFAQEGSPYRALCRHAGLEFGDIEACVRRDGLEPALDRLAQEGVFVTVNEFRGRDPIRRGRFELPVRAGDFDSPLSTSHLTNRSGGSTGQPRPVPFHLDLAVSTTPIEMVFLDVAGIRNRPMGLYRTCLPNIAGFVKTLYQLRMGHVVERWFSEKKMADGLREWPYALFTLYLHLAADFHGRGIPLPEHTPPENAARVAEWLAAKKAEGTPAVLDAVASTAVRVAHAALKNGLDISGSAFRVSSEPFTEGRAAICSRAGVRAYPHYAMTETGMAGLPCLTPEEVDEVHVLKDRVAVIQRRQEIAGCEAAVDALYVTALVPTASRVVINLESGDCGVLRSRACGCALGALGMNDTLHTIRSYEKLTSAGVTFVSFDLDALLERVLPAAFGGAPSDYQLVEGEIDGLPRVDVVISPRVGPVDEPRVVQAVVAFLSARDAGHRLMARVLREGAGLGVLRREPYLTSSFKLHPLHVFGRDRRVAAPRANVSGN